MTSRRLKPEDRQLVRAAANLLDHHHRSDMANKLRAMVKGNPLSPQRRHEIGVMGGHARAAKLSPERKSEIGRIARAASRGKNQMVTS